MSALEEELAEAQRVVEAIGIDPLLSGGELIFNALHLTRIAIIHEQARPEPRLSCLRTALVALTGALKDRMREEWLHRKTPTHSAEERAFVARVLAGNSDPKVSQ